MGQLSAAAVVIGNEVLTAKVQDLNGPLLIRRLRECGIALRQLEVVPDDVDMIVDSVIRSRARARYVFTSGGIGPTHDDVTVRAVALALGRRVVRLPKMEALVKEYYGPDVSAEALRLADAPEGAELWAQEGTWYPVLSCADVFMLPGVPQLFKLQLETVLGRLERSVVHLRTLYLSAREPQIAHILDRVALTMPHVAIGSYPNFDRAIDYAVKLTVEHDQGGPVEEAVARLLRELPAGSVLRIE